MVAWHVMSFWLKGIICWYTYLDFYFYFWSLHCNALAGVRYLQSWINQFRHNFQESYCRLLTGDSQKIWVKPLLVNMRKDKRSWHRKRTTVLTLTMRPSSRCCPSLSSGLAEMTRKYSVLWEISVTVTHLTKKASPVLLHFTKSTARFWKPSRKCARVFVVRTD